MELPDSLNILSQELLSETALDSTGQISQSVTLVSRKLIRLFVLSLCRVALFIKVYGCASVGVSPNSLRYVRSSASKIYYFLAMFPFRDSDYCCHIASFAHMFVLFLWGGFTKSFALKLSYGGSLE